MSGMEWIIFALKSLGAAAIGVSIVIAASQIERGRRTRHDKACGEH